MPKKDTRDEFIEKSKQIHGNEFDYNSVEYKNSKQKVYIRHNKCGRYFWQSPVCHLQGQSCPHCAGKMKLTTEEFVTRASIVHSDKYNYDNVEYKNMHTKVKIKHNKCDKYFLQSPFEHLKGCGCPYCAGKIKLTTEEFIARANIVHGDKYDYSLVNYINTKNKIKIKHNKCGKMFEQLPSNHLQGQKCSYCFRKIKLTTEGL